MSFGIGRGAPEYCAIDQVIMIRRHGERYPQASDAAGIEDVLEKLYSLK
jgi:acid phosphatase